MYTERIESLRAMMRGRGWDAVILTGSDPHSSEYPAARWKQVEWLTGFTGEAGDVVVTLDHAGLWTDTRYFIAARQQLAGTGVELHKMRVPGQIPIPEWLASVFEGEDPVIAVDALCQNVDAIEALESAFGASPHTIVGIPDLLSPLWESRPAIPQTPVYTLDESLTGLSRSSKLLWIREFLDNNSCDGVLFTALDEIAWMLNVRASDIEYNPFVISYLLVTQERCCWFVLKDPTDDPLTDGSFDLLSSEGVELLPYSDLAIVLSQEFEGSLFVDTSTLNMSVSEVLEDAGIQLVRGTSPVVLRKAVKNPVEVEGMRRAHLEDGVAMEKFLYWIETSLGRGERISERDASEYLGSLRSEIEGYLGDSFETISAYGSGAALPHYVTPRHDAPLLEPHGLYLCDSGGQYLFGTTDITRTVPLGRCTPLEREDYTLVLKGHIALAKAVFPRGTAGCQIDVLAREPLWASKRNFGHGTGHGVGFCLGVHEGPQDIRQNFNRQPLLPGMITSDEPGLYREGMHGIRHENLVLCVESGANDFGDWLCFETLTLCHFDTSAIEPSLLDKSEIDWLNAYNARVYETLSPRLPEEVALWLRDKTKPLSY
ncbi:MAG: aminopeptidase P family protein [Candidatus Cryptobacteroides sp.]|nr:aminopeptidase P family protein [Candidatus Cryptobacteroides sp.]